MNSLKVKTLRRIITPPAGCLLAGYGPRIKSDGVHDELYISGMAFDDGRNKAILLSFDLLGLDRDFIEEIREAAAGATGIAREKIMLSCTHTHSGPHTRRMATLNFDENLQREFEERKKFLIAAAAAAVDNAFAEMAEVDVYHYSVSCHENVNRRILPPDNNCVYLPYNKYLTALATGFTDPELGIIYFVAKNSGDPVAVLVNYAAHPLSSQSAGASSHKITADYPGVLRREVEENLGGMCIFVQGACGDLHPKGCETGFRRTEEMGRNIAAKVINSFSDAVWNPEKYRFSDTDLQVSSVKTDVKFRKSGCLEGRLPLYEGRDTVELELQILSLGDMALVGVPGEMLCEPGMEIKWHSPFRKTFILYNSTAYISYIPHANAFVSGGYEAETSHLEPSAAFKLVAAAIDALNAARDNAGAQPI